MHKNKAPESTAMWITSSQLLTFFANNGITEIDATTMNIFKAAKKSKRLLKFIQAVKTISKKAGEVSENQALLT
ncbi:hypothetical protein N476_00115 [Pseudoalteromonas luteoviolacea H33]|uniref:Uncharacterized protein n=1 Tax=Pseudoalteromonas luteoviolacea H33 TaxID=1365251 RepID=A0A167GSK4_9GAMM|nr:hypothetical protein N476_00115 [Pseudoalteromonas luteoviolacea H33]